MFASDLWIFFTNCKPLKSMEYSFLIFLYLVLPVQSHFAKNRIHTYFVFQVLAQSICMNCNIYIKCERPAPSSKSKNFLPVQTVCMGHYFVLRHRRCVWAWQFLLFAAWLNGGMNNAIATEHRLREWWGNMSVLVGVVWSFNLPFTVTVSVTTLFCSAKIWGIYSPWAFDDVEYYLMQYVIQLNLNFR